eukprot:6193890-Pleurochrysis_carterae.AAC.1
MKSLFTESVGLHWRLYTFLPWKRRYGWAHADESHPVSSFKVFRMHVLIQECAADLKPRGEYTTVACKYRYVARLNVACAMTAVWTSDG